MILVPRLLAEIYPIEHLFDQTEYVITRDAWQLEPTDSRITELALKGFALTESSQGSQWLVPLTMSSKWSKRP